MQALKDYAKLVAQVEQALKRAAPEGITLNQLVALPSVAEHATGKQQIRDLVDNMRKHQCVDAQRTGSGPKAPLAFKWVDGMLYQPVAAKRNKPTKAPSPVQATKYAAPNPNEVELCLNGIEIVIGVNPATGRVRLRIGD